MEYKIVIPSHNRPKIKTLEYLKRTNISLKKIEVLVNDKEQKKAYVKENPNLKITCSNQQGLLQNINWLLKREGKGKRIVLIEDDVTTISQKVLATLHEVADLAGVIEDGFEKCELYNAHLWGVYPVPNHFFMKRRINNAAFIIMSFCGIVVTELRYDLEIPFKGDYDFALQHILRDKKIIRFDWICVQAAHYSKTGGVSDVRSDEAQLAGIGRLMLKYPGVVKRNPRRKGEILLRFKK